MQTPDDNQGFTRTKLSRRERDSNPRYSKSKPHFECGAFSQTLPSLHFKFTDIYKSLKTSYLINSYLNSKKDI